MSSTHHDDVLLKKLFDQYFGHLVIFANRIVESRPLAEDIVQEVFLKLWENGRLKTSTPLFLFNCVKNAAINYQKKAGIKYISLPEERQIAATPENEDIFEEKERMEKLEQLYQAIEKLPPQSREVLKLVYLQKQKYAEVALQMEISLNTVRSHMYSAMKLLRQHLLPQLSQVLIFAWILTSL
jgi:RNA polymerase sigma-70 factor, ECF subfamily